MKAMPRIFNDMLGLFYPELCISCEERLISQEKYICTKCWFDLPVNNFHQESDNKVAQLFWGRVQIENAASYFNYRKGSKYQKLIHFIKYKGLKELGYEMGVRYGNVLFQSEKIWDIDIVVPVPLHPRKQNKRGYNQSEWIARGLAVPLTKPVSADNLFRKLHTSTQTRKNRFERWQNVEGIFGIKHPGEFSGKHILLVDDVVTTGSTLEASAFQLLKIEDTRVSIATLGFADY
ncbi:MAG: ComF family protein [Mariniphaga sp.]